jgi:hypothetical protein
LSRAIIPKVYGYRRAQLIPIFVGPVRVELTLSRT